jgi:hypothetical protein
MVNWPFQANVSRQSDGAHSSRLVWNYSGQYHDIVTDGGRKPPPSFGSPTFVWHVGIWRKVSEVIKDHSSASFGDKVNDIASKFEEQDEHNEKFFEEINGFVKRLQERGRVQRGDALHNIDGFKFQAPPPREAALRREHAGHKTAHRFKDCEPQSLAFTLWWMDSQKDGSPLPNARSSNPAYSALRVRVQVVTHFEHVTLSFYIDAAKPYGKPQLYVRGDLPVEEYGFRRERITQDLTRLRAISAEQIRQGWIERDRIPEQGISEDDATALQEIAEYFYEGIWQDFMKSFGIHADGHGRILIDTIEGHKHRSEGEIFLDHRGLVMAVDGLDTPLNFGMERRSHSLREKFSQPTQAHVRERMANASFGRFSRFDPRANEPSVVLKSYWPFIRRFVPWADYRDVIGCGITEWRSLYVNSLAVSGSFYGDDEGPGRQAEVLDLGHEKEGRAQTVTPVTYLVLTKGEPHREQIGRFVDRINALATNRLFALKNLRTIKNAGSHINLLGRELDGILRFWGDERQAIEDKYYWKLAAIYNPKIKNLEKAEIDKILRKIKENKILLERDPDPKLIEQFIDWGELTNKLADGDIKLPRIQDAQKVPEARIQELLDVRVQELASLVKRVERRLVEIGSSLDNVGTGGSGRLLFVINRSKIHMNEFERMATSLEIGNIDGWVTYEQFVHRSVLPTFDMIRATGDRLVGLRERLQSVTEMIQTSALIIESEATRQNTAILRRIQSNIFFVGIPIGLMIAILLVNGKELPKNPSSLLPWLLAALAILAPTIKFLAEKYRQKRKDRAAHLGMQLDVRRLLSSLGSGKKRS